MPREERSKNPAFTSAQILTCTPHSMVVQRHFERIDPKRHKLHLLKVAMEAGDMKVASRAFKKLRDSENRYVKGKVKGEKLSRFNEILFILGGGKKYPEEAFTFMKEQQGRQELEHLKTALDSEDEKAALDALLEVRKNKHKGVPKVMPGIYPLSKLDRLLFVIGRGKEKETKLGMEFLHWQHENMEWLA